MQIVFCRKTCRESRPVEADVDITATNRGKQGDAAVIREVSKEVSVCGVIGLSKFISRAVLNFEYVTRGADKAWALSLRI